MAPKIHMTLKQGKEKGRESQHQAALSVLFPEQMAIFLI